MGRTKGSKNKATLEREKKLLEAITGKKDKKEQEQTSTQPQPQSQTQIQQNKTKPKKEIPTCERCHKEDYNLQPIDLVYLSKRAGWWRKSKNDRPMLCSDCTLKLNQLIDEFLIDDGKGVEVKEWCQESK